MGQHRFTGNVTHGEYVGNVGALLLVHRDKAPVIDMDTGVIGADLFTVRMSAQRHQDPVKGVFRRRPGAGKTDHQAVFAGSESRSRGYPGKYSRTAWLCVYAVV